MAKTVKKKKIIKKRIKKAVKAKPSVKKAKSPRKRSIKLRYKAPSSAKKLKKQPAAGSISTRKPAGESIVGVITHYFPKVRAAVIELKGVLSVGDTIRVKGHTSDLKQTVSSIQINHISVKSAVKGDEIGLLVDSRVREGDSVLIVK